MHQENVDVLELTVDPGRTPASAGRFFQLGHDLLALLDELSETPIDWRISRVWNSSAGVAVAPPENKAEEARALRLVIDGLDRVSAGLALQTNRWSPDAVRSARRLVEDGRAEEGETDWVAPHLALVTDVQPPPHVDLTPELGQKLQTC